MITARNIVRVDFTTRFMYTRFNWEYNVVTNEVVLRKSYTATFLSDCAISIGET